MDPVGNARNVRHAFRAVESPQKSRALRKIRLFAGLIVHRANAIAARPFSCSHWREEF